MMTFPGWSPEKTNPTKITKSFERSLVPDAQRLEVTNKLSGKKNPPSPKKWPQRMHPGSPTDPRDVATNLDLLRQFFALETAVTKIKPYWTDRQSEAEVGGTSYREKHTNIWKKVGSPFNPSNKDLSTWDFFSNADAVKSRELKPTARQWWGRRGWWSWWWWWWWWWRWWLTLFFY